MSQENVEALKDVYAHWEQGDFWTSDIFDPEVEIVWADDMPDFRAGEEPGMATIEAGIRNLLAAWEDFACIPEEFLPVEDSVLVLFTARGRGKGSQVQVEAKWAHLWTFKDGRAIRMEVFTDQGKGREAAGLV